MLRKEWREGEVAKGAMLSDARLAASVKSSNQKYHLDIEVGEQSQL